MKSRGILAGLLILSLLTPVPSNASSSALGLLDFLSVSPESNSNTYDRELFKHWVDKDGDRCDTREEVLKSESTSEVKTDKNCKLLSGSWRSKYDNRVITKASSLDIDHMIPLKEAWKSGASGWSAADRQEFANDLDFDGSLIAVSASSNRSKADRDPSAWMPNNKSFHCIYAVTWIQVKYRWSLTVDQAELAALRTHLTKCPENRTYTLPPKALTNGSPASPTQTPSQTPSPSQTNGLDPRFSTCKEAKAAGYGPYRRGVDPEYQWYRDGDGDGITCE
jgi:hypothetical protein